MAKRHGPRTGPWHPEKMGRGNRKGWDMITTRGQVTLHFDVVGRGDPILLLHPFPLCRKFWDPVLDALSRKNRLIIPDLRGMGESTATEKASMSDHAQDVLEVLHATGETRPLIVVAVSMGGYVAFELLRQARERVRALVLSNTKATADTEEGKKGRAEMIAAVRERGSVAAAEVLVRKLFGKQLAEGVKYSWLKLMEKTPAAGMIAAMQAMMDRPDSMEDLKNAKVPTLLIAGAEDQITPPSDLRAIHDVMPQSKVIVVEGAGHLTAVEQPEIFCAKVREFVDKLAALPDTEPLRPAFPEMPVI